MFLLASLSGILLLAGFVYATGLLFYKLIPKSYDDIAEFVLPIIGLGFVILPVIALGWLLPFSFLTSSAFLISIVTLALFVHRKNLTRLGEGVKFSVFCVVASTPVLAPLILFDSYNPFNDTFTYLVHGQWLQSHAFSEQVQASGYFPALTQVSLYQNAGHRMGASFFLGFVQSLLRLEWSYHAYIPVVSIFLATGSYTVAAVLKRLLSFSHFQSIVFALVPAFFMSGWVFGAQYGFLPQTAGMCFFIATVCFSLLYSDWLMKNRPTFGQSFRYCLPISLAAAGMLYCYNDMFVIVAGSLTIFVISQAIRFRENAIILLIQLSIILTQTAVLVNFEGLRVTKNFLNSVLNAASGTVVFGWPVPWETIQFYALSFGLKGPHNDTSLSLDQIVSFWAFPIFLCAVLFALYKVRKIQIGRVLIDLFVVFNVVFILAFIKFRYFTPDIAGQVGHAFLQFKLATWLGAVNLIITAVVLAFFYRSWPFPQLIKNGAVASVFLLIGSIHIFVAAPNFTTHFLSETQRDRNAFQFFVDLRQQLSSIPKTETVYLGIPHEHHKLTQMVAYILYDRSLAGIYKDGYIRGHLPEIEKEMPVYLADWYLQHKPNRSISDDFYKRIGPLMLLSTGDHRTTLKSKIGGYNAETANGNVWNWVKDRIEFQFEVFAPKSQKKDYLVSFEHLLAGKPRVLSIAVTSANGASLHQEKINLKPGWGAYQSEPFQIETDQVSIIIEADGEPVRLSERDERVAKFLIQNLDLNANIIF